MTKDSWLAKYASAFAFAGLLAACSAAGSGAGPANSPPNGRESGLTTLSAQRLAALTMPHYQSGPVRTDRGKSWMRPGTNKLSRLAYIGDWGTNDVYVFDYPTMEQVGTLTGFDEPYGMCVDQKGDIFVANFGNGELIEYAHGGSSPINTYASDGYAIGCSISPSGDVSETDFYTSTGAGDVCVWKGGSGSSTCYSDGNACYYMWTFGYDRAGDIIGVGEYSSIVECMLPSGGSSMETLTAKGITIDFPGGTQWDGKYIALGDQEAGGTYKSGVWEATLSGTTLTAVGPEIVFKGNCYSDYTDDVNPFFFSGRHNVTAARTRLATRVIGPNLWCYDQGKPEVDVWKYPSGNPAFQLKGSPLTEPYGAAVSIAK